MSLSEETARVAGGGKNTLKTILQKLGVTVGSEKIDQYPALAEKITGSIGNYGLHCWVRRSVTSGTYTLSSVVNTPYQVQLWNRTDRDGYQDYCTAIEVDGAGVYTPVESTKATWTYQYDNVTQSQLNALKGKFLLDSSWNRVRVYIPTSATVSKGIVDSYYGIIFSQYQTVIGVPEKVGDWESVFSSERSTYPDSGIKDGYYYYYLGVPFESFGKAANLVSEKISYLGTGNYGESSPCSLTFKIPPKYVWWSYQAYYDGASTSVIGPGYGTIVDMDALKTTYTKGVGFSSSNEHNTVYTKKSADGRTLTWYNTDSAMGQLNEAGDRYGFIAFF